MFKTVQRACLLVLIGGVLGLLGNALSPKGVPLVTPPKKEPKKDEFTPLTKAHELWSSGTTFFLDARRSDDYEAGHIPNAVSLPVEEFGEKYPKVAPLLTPEASIVVYCNGTECELSHQLATLLKEQGYTNVHMLFNGWTTWTNAGYPTETGPGK